MTARRAVVLAPERCRAQCSGAPYGGTAMLPTPKMLRILTSLLLAATPALPASLPPDLERAVAEFNRAQFANDVATLSRLVADDYLLVNSDSSLQDKASFLTDF